MKISHVINIHFFYGSSVYSQKYFYANTAILLTEFIINNVDVFNYHEAHNKENFPITVLTYSKLSPLT